ncbi:MAG: CsbD family protein [Gemmataceae bacterium]
MQLNALHARADHVMGRDRIKEQWSDLASKLRHRWRKLKWQDVLRPDGDSEYLAGLLEER